MTGGKGCNICNSSAPLQTSWESVCFRLNQVLRDTIYQAVNQSAAPQSETNPHPCGNGRKLINLIPCPFQEKMVRDSKGQNLYIGISAFFLLWQRKGGADSTYPPLSWSQQSVEVGGRKGFLQSLCLWGSRRARAQFYNCWPKHNLSFTN